MGYSKHLGGFATMPALFSCSVGLLLVAIGLHICILQFLHHTL